MDSPIPESKTGLVLALGGGGAPGLAHIGVLQVLAEHSIPVRAVTGTSIGAEIGAFVASGMPVDDLARIATSFDWRQTLQLFMPDLPTGGLISGVKIVDFLQGWIGGHQIEDLAMGYAAVGADLATGAQVVIDRGDLVEAVRGSISIPGLIAPHQHGQHWLVDGGVLNPLPFDVARERFGGPVLAVAVHAGARRPPPDETLQAASSQWPGKVRQLLNQPWMARAPLLKDWLETQLRTRNGAPRSRPYWTTRRVLDRAMNMAEAEIVRLRAMNSPPDLVLTPQVEDIGVLEFYRAEEAITAGRKTAQNQLAAIEKLLAHTPA